MERKEAKLVIQDCEKSRNRSPVKLIGCDVKVLERSELLDCDMWMQYRCLTYSR